MKVKFAELKLFSKLLGNKKWLNCKAYTLRLICDTLSGHVIGILTQSFY